MSASRPPTLFGPGAPDPSDPSIPQVRTMSTTMLRGGLWPAAVVAVLAVVVAGVIGGGGALLSAAVSAVVTLAACTVGPLLMRVTAASDPVVIMAVALAGFMVKMGVLLVILLVVRAFTPLDVQIFALTLGAVTVAFILGEMVGFWRARTPTIAV